MPDFGSNLFRRASQAAQRVSRAEFRRTQIGRLVSHAERLAHRGRGSRFAMAQLGRELSKLHSRGVFKALQEAGGFSGIPGQGLVEVAQYAASGNGPGKFRQFLFDQLFNSLGPLGQVIKALMQPSGKNLATSLSRELTGATKLLQAFGFEVVAPPRLRSVTAGGELQDKAEAAQRFLESLGWTVVPPDGSVGGAGGRASSGQAPAAPISGPNESNPFAPGSYIMPGPAPQQPTSAFGPGLQSPGGPGIGSGFGGSGGGFGGFGPAPSGGGAAGQPGGGSSGGGGDSGQPPVPPREGRGPSDDPAWSGQMITVQSSNVHSIGFDINTDAPSVGTLKVRFLHSSGDSKTKNKSPGSLYFYYNVPTELFRAFLRASSKGDFVWDKLRIRGTVSGHRFDYSLQGISQGYIPRKATNLADGEWFIKRNFAGRWSQLPNAPVRTMDRGGESDDGEPNRGRPNRGGPNRGGPNRGTPNRGRN